jgi:hypothetical protein
MVDPAVYSSADRCDDFFATDRRNLQHVKQSGCQGPSAVQVVISRLRPTLNERSWKEWVSKRADVTVKWLSRAANKGEFSLPMFERSSLRSYGVVGNFDTEYHIALAILGMVLTA